MSSSGRRSRSKPSTKRRISQERPVKRRKLEKNEQENVVQENQNTETISRQVQNIRSPQIERNTQNTQNTQIGRRETLQRNVSTPRRTILLDDIPSPRDLPSSLEEEEEDDDDLGTFTFDLDYSPSDSDEFPEEPSFNEMERQFGEMRREIIDLDEDVSNMRENATRRERPPISLPSPRRRMDDDDTGFLQYLIGRPGDENVPRRLQTLIRHQMLMRFYERHLEDVIAQSYRFRDYQRQLIEQGVDPRIANLAASGRDFTDEDYETLLLLDCNVQHKTIPKEDMKKLKTRKIEEHEKVQECSICLCGMEKGHVVRELNCKHIFHQDCVDTWLCKYNHTCPVCKNEAI